MSCDFGIWFPHQRLSDAEAGRVYQQLCASDLSGLQAHPAVSAFYEELTAKYPEIDTIPEERIGDHDYCPWSCALDHSDAYVITTCVWPQAEAVYTAIHELGRKHGLAVYDPQSSHITYPPPNHALQRTATGGWLSRVFQALLRR